MGPWRSLFFAGQQLTSPSQPCGWLTVCGLAGRPRLMSLSRRRSLGTESRRAIDFSSIPIALHFQCRLDDVAMGLGAKYDSTVLCYWRFGFVAKFVCTCG